MSASASKLSTPRTYYVGIKISPHTSAAALMPHATRSSGARLAIEAADQDAEDVTAILNEEAANSTSTPPRKRKRISDASGNMTSPAKKRIQLEQPAAPAAETTTTATNSPRRQSGRLQARKSLTAPTPVDKRRIFEIPDEDEAETAATPPAVPGKKLKILNKQAKKTTSPFKGRGILETRTNARVNFDESPKKRKGPPAKNTWSKISRSVQGNARSLRKEEDAAGSDAGRAPFDEENIFEAAQQEVNQPPSPELGRPLTKERPPNDENATGSTQRSSPLKSRRRAQPAGRDTSFNHGLEQGRHQPANHQNPLAEAAKRTEAENETLQAHAKRTRGLPEPRNNIAEDDVVEDEVLEEEDGALRNGDASDDVSEDKSPDAEDKDVPATDPHSEAQRPQTDAERKAAELAAEEAEARREEMIAEELSGIESAVELHDCKGAWTGALLAAAEIVQDRASSDLRSTLGRACEREFRNLTNVYRRLSRVSSGSFARLNPTNWEILERLEERCKHLGSHCYQRDGRRDPERKRMVQDIYEHLIPRSLKLTKWALRARFRNDRLSRHALEEICELLDITYDLVESARLWKPRPELENGVKSKTQSEIKQRVEFLRKRYRGIIHESGRTKFVDELERRAAENRQRLEAEHRRMVEAARARHRRPSYPNDAAVEGQLSASSQLNVVDIDDIAGNGEPMLDNHSRESSRHINGSIQPMRPRLRREPTEDIPAPNEPQWSDPELKVLVNALQEFRGEARWEDIMDAYSGPRGWLRKYDMDQIMAKARWVKQSMARQLKELDESWDWLRSVPS